MLEEQMRKPWVQNALGLAFFVSFLLVLSQSGSSASAAASSSWSRHQRNNYGKKLDYKNQITPNKTQSKATGTGTSENGGTELGEGVWTEENRIGEALKITDEYFQERRIVLQGDGHRGRVFGRRGRGRKTRTETGGCRIFREYSTIGSSRSGLEKG